MAEHAQHSVSGDVLGQFEQAWSMLADALQRFSAEQWREDAGPLLAPARIAYHIVETAEYYLTEDPVTVRSGGEFGVDWEAADAGTLPTQEVLLAYLARVRDACRQWFCESEKPGMLAPDPVYGGEGMSRLDRSLYLLRHTHHHIGELCARLRGHGVPRPNWR